MNRDKNIDIETLELAQPGFANGISTYLRDAIKEGKHSLTDEQKLAIIEEATVMHSSFFNDS